MTPSRLTALAKALDRLRAEREQLIQPEPLRFALLDFAAAALEALEQECKHDHWTVQKGMVTCQEAACRSVCKFCAALAAAETVADAILGKEERDGRA